MLPAPRATVSREAFALAFAAPLMCALATLACLRVGWWIVFDARIGPVVATLSPGRGVHSGDVFGVCFLALALAFAAGAYLSMRGPRRVLSLDNTR